MFDVTIIGAGVIGCSIARELSKYKLDICVVEKETDVAEGTTKANSAIVHAGFDARTGSLKGKLNAKGNAMFDKLSEELDFPFKRNGSLVLCFEDKAKERLLELKIQGEKNGVPNLRILNKKELFELEPNVSNKAVAALYAPSSGIVCPYEMTIALAENAYANGVQFKFNCEVKDIIKKSELFIIKTGEEDIQTRLVINAAGLHSDDINNFVSKTKIIITPRRGEYCLFDKAVGSIIKRTVFQLPTTLGKGVLATPTVDGNLLIGPNAVDINRKDDLATTEAGFQEIHNKALEILSEIPIKSIITSFSGLRAHSDSEDFIIGEIEDAEGFINAAAIESPGLSSAPAIAELIENLVVGKLFPKKKESFNPIRRGIPKFRELSMEDRQKLIESNAAFGRIVCRCEMVTEGEIIEAIRRPLGARTLDGIKRRTRAQMGRCQAGFCTPRLIGILAKELNLPEEEVTKFGGDSNMLVGKVKEI